MARRGPPRDAKKDEALVRYLTPTAKAITRHTLRRLPHWVHRDDVMAAAMVGVWDAVLRNGHLEPDELRRYARVRIRGAIIDSLRKADWLSRRARPRVGDMRVFIHTDDEELERIHVAPPVEEPVDSDELNRCFKKLGARDRRILSLKFWRGMKQSDIAVLLGLSEPRVSQITTRAVTRLREMMQRSADDETDTDSSDEKKGT